MSDVTNNRFYRTQHPDRHGPGCGCVGYGTHWDGDTLAEVAQIVAKWSCPPLENPANTGLLRELRAVLNDELRGVDQQIDRLTALADRLAGRIAAVEEQLAALDGLATSEVTPSDDMRAAFGVAARGIRAALGQSAETDAEQRALLDESLRNVPIECADCGPVDPEHADAHDEHHA